MKRFIRFAVVAGVLFVGVAAYAQAAESPSTTTIQAEGAGVVINRDRAIARDNAVYDALRKAVEQAVGAVISSETVVQNYQVINDSIYARAQGYIQNYRIIDERENDSLYVVTVRATVALGKVRDDLSALGLLMARKGMPRVLVLIAEQNIGQRGPASWTDSVDLSISENKVQEIFLKDGFTFVDRTAALERIKRSDQYKSTSLSNAAAAALAKDLNAELVIVGKAYAKQGGTVAGTAMKSIQATVSARVIRADTGVVIASTTGQGATIHIDDIAGGVVALGKAAESLSALLKGQIIDRWQSDVASTTTVSLVVRGVKSYSDFVRFRELLKSEIRGVKNVFQRKMEAGTAQLDLESERGAQALADELVLKSLSGFVVDVTSVTQNNIEVTITHK
ncbi:MAG: flagellar assembly protein T N-terminal domain-containing protein [Deltaproteobacteria bacterium]|nr:flagellar assembly protein T N-terminal domain-containing protein [Deltaproteobacteria bacterium]